MVDNGQGTLYLNANPTNPTVYARLAASFNQTDFGYVITSANKSALNASYQLVLQQSIYSSLQSTINFTVAAFDAMSRLSDNPTLQVALLISVYHSVLTCAT